MEQLREKAINVLDSLLEIAKSECEDENAGEEFKERLYCKLCGEIWAFQHIDLITTREALNYIRLANAITR